METVTQASDTSIAVQTEVQQEMPSVSQPVLRLRLKKPKNERKVCWTVDTIDNENMNKKKSKCCCIYRKSYEFGESSSEDDEECEHCFGHPEKRRRNLKTKDNDHILEDKEQSHQPLDHTHGHHEDEDNNVCNEIDGSSDCHIKSRDKPPIENSPKPDVSDNPDKIPTNNSHSTPTSNA